MSWRCRVEVSPESRVRDGHAPDWPGNPLHQTGPRGAGGAGLGGGSVGRGNSPIFEQAVEDADGHWAWAATGGGGGGVGRGRAPSSEQSVDESSGDSASAAIGGGRGAFWGRSAPSSEQPVEKAGGNPAWAAAGRSKPEAPGPLGPAAAAPWGEGHRCPNSSPSRSSEVGPGGRTPARTGCTDTSELPLECTKLRYGRTLDGGRRPWEAPEIGTGGRIASGTWEPLTDEKRGIRSASAMNIGAGQRCVASAGVERCRTSGAALRLWLAQSPPSRHLNAGAFG